MDTPEISMPQHHRVYLNRFVAACQADERVVAAFLSNLSHHFMSPIARGQLLSAYGPLEDLRRACVNLARLRQNFSAEAEGYEKVEQALPVEQLATLQETICPLEKNAMLRAALVVVRFYQQLVPALAQAHGIPYPAKLVQVMSQRLVQLCQASGVDVATLAQPAR